MTNEELRQLAAIGVRERVQTIQAELSMYHEEWPELFQSATAPPLLKVSTNGHGPAPSKRASSWTPARRAAQAQRMKDRAKAKVDAFFAVPKPRRLSAATRRKLALAMKRRHASGQIARAKKRAAKERANGESATK
jgi:hypothetical protein